MEIDKSIAFIVDWWPPNHDGGDSIFARDLITWLRQHIRDSIVFTHIPEKTKTTITYDKQGNCIYYLGNNLSESYKELDEFTPDIIHFFQIHNKPIIEWLSSRYISQKPFKIFHMEICFRRYEELFTPDYNANIYNTFEQELARNADLIITPSNEEKLHIERLLGVRDVYVVPNTVNYDIRLCTEPYLSTSNKIRFIFAGRIDDPMKGGDIIYSALDKIPDNFRDKLSFHFIGTHSNKDQIAQYIPSSIEYKITPWIKDEFVFGNILENHDCLLMPSRYEPFGVLCLEGMAQGLIPFVTDTGGLKEIIIDKKNGFIIPNPNNNQKDYVAQCLVNKIIGLNKLNITTLKRNALRRARDDYHIAKSGEEILKIYANVGDLK